MEVIHCKSRKEIYKEEAEQSRLMMAISAGNEAKKINGVSSIVLKVVVALICHLFHIKLAVPCARCYAIN